MTWATPWLWWIAVPVGVAWWLTWRRREATDPAAVTVPHVPSGVTLPVTWVERLWWIPDALRTATLALLIVALGRPRTGMTQAEVTTDGVDLLIAVDTSRSMAALDLDSGPMQSRRTRLDVAKEIIRSFADRRTQDQVGVVVFGSQAWTHAPLTLDHPALDNLIDRVTIGMAGDATALGDGLGIAIKRLQKSKARSRVVVLLTDGRTTAGAVDPRVAAEAAAKVGVKVYTIGVGTEGEAPVLVEGMLGARVQTIRADLDEPTLQAIADQTGAAYFRATDADALGSVFDQIDRLERSPIEAHRSVDWTEHYPWLVGGALALLVLEVVLRSTRFRSLP